MMWMLQWRDAKRVLHEKSFDTLAEAKAFAATLPFRSVPTLELPEEEAS